MGVALAAHVADLFEVNERDLRRMYARPGSMAAFIPLAFTTGTDFRPARRIDREEVLHWDRW
ncbi:hypothetical protein [Nonomuraea dietziae]|uniref:hypothetical protein n=1 Tax=Nonomuraea dietziae TaxID=65515 RepID=UPI0033F20AE1